MAAALLIVIGLMLILGVMQRMVSAQRSPVRVVARVGRAHLSRRR